MRDNTIQVHQHEHRRPSKRSQQLHFSEVVDVLCTNSSKRTCVLAHCWHGQVQQTFSQLQNRINLVSAPLSVPLAVLSSKADDNESDNFVGMQKLSGVIPVNEMEAPPWDLQRRAMGADDDDELTTGSESGDMPDTPGNQNDGRETPPDEPQAHPPTDEDDRQSVLLYHLNDIPVHTMLHWADFAVMMREVAHHFAIDRVDLLDCHDMTTYPSDVPEGTVPLIVQLARDIPVGEPSVLVMVDIVMHGQTHEAHFQTAPQVRRSVMPLPVMLLRQALLIQTRLFEYCRFEHHRCLVTHEGSTWPMQEVLPRRIQHGNYIQVTVPPPQYCEVSTRDMIADSRNLTIENFWNRYYVPTPPEVQEESEESETDVSPSLIGSEDIRREFGNLDDLDSDVNDLMQRPPHGNQSASSNDMLDPSADIINVTQQIVSESCVLNFHPNNLPWPLWLRALSTSFGDEAWIENDDEGPVAFLTTWYADCSVVATSEVSRVVRLDSHRNLWINDIQTTWQDKIQRNVPVHFAWVNPRPTEAPTAHTIGHLIVFQNPSELRAPILMNFQFRALHLDGTAHAVAVVPNGITPEELARQVNLDRVCTGRRCTLHRGTPGKRWFDTFTNGEGIKMVIPPPGERADAELHWGLGSVALVELGPLVVPTPILSMRLEDHPLFIQNLHDIWLRHGQGDSVSAERFLEISTWYLDGVHVPYNDEKRQVLLGDDFTTWEQDLRRAWNDLEDASEDMHFSFVKPTPPCSPLSEVHVLLFQQLNQDQVGMIVTKYDNSVRQSAPFTVAVACHNPVSKTMLVEKIGSAADCSSPDTHCSLWSEQHEIGEDGHRFDHGMNVQVHIYRHFLPSWTSDEDDLDEHVLMQQNAISSGTQPVAEQSDCEPFVFNLNAPVFVPGRPPIAALPEHMQDLYVLWDRHASAHEAAERKSSVQTWYLSPGMNRLRCGYCRKVHLYEDYMQWEWLMTQAWQDELVPNKPVFFFLVQPTPNALEYDIAAHLILVQEPTDSQVASLVTLFDEAVHQGHPFRIAIVTHEHITRDEVIERVGYTDELRRLGDRIRCTFQHAFFTVPLNRPVPGRDGDNLVVRLTRESIEADWRPPFLPVRPGMEGVHFLQQRASRIRRSGDPDDEESCADENDGEPFIQVDLTPAIQTFEWLDTHFMLMSFCPPPDALIPVESQPWIDLPIWEAEFGGQEMWVYFDGSYQPDAEHARISVAVFIRSSHKWFQAGLISAQVQPTGSYTAELHASIAAAKITHDILKVFACHHLVLPNVWFCFDSLTVGNQLLGHWKCQQHPLLGRCIRI